jgi:hypothetical protein
VAVETLAIGDLLLTGDGRVAPVLWIGRQTVATRFADPLRTLPIRVKAGALRDSLPARDLLVSPGHAPFVGTILIHAGALVNGTTITRESDVPEKFTYYHIELEDHALILAEKVPAETFVDNVSHGLRQLGRTPGPVPRRPAGAGDGGTPRHVRPAGAHGHPARARSPRGGNGRVGCPGRPTSVDPA